MVPFVSINLGISNRAARGREFIRLLEFSIHVDRENFMSFTIVKNYISNVQNKVYLFTNSAKIRKNSGESTHACPIRSIDFSKAEYR